MKKSLLALAVASVAAASFASTASATTVYDKDGTSIDLYGRVQSVYYSDKASGVMDADGEGKGSIQSTARLGFSLRTQLTPGIAGFAKGEWEMGNGDNAADDASGYKARYLWVGTDFGQFGAVKFGKFEEAIADTLAYTDIFEDWGTAGQLGNDDKREGVVEYMWNGNGVSAVLSYQFAKQASLTDGAWEKGEKTDIDYSIAANIAYTTPDVVFGPISVSAGYNYAKFISNAGANSWTMPNDLGQTMNLDYDNYKQFAVAASWGSLDVGPYIAALYQQRKYEVNYSNTVDVTDNGSDTYTGAGYEFVAGYTFTNGIFVATGYNNLTVKNYFQDGDISVKTVPVYACWNLNPQFRVWAEARFDAGSDVAGNTFVDGADENMYSAGVRYSF